MNLQKKLSENLTLHFVEANNWDHDEEGNEVTTMYELSFSFYGNYYSIYVAPKNLEEEYARYASVEGPGELFESFNELVEEEYWEEVVTQCKAFEVWNKELSFD